MKKCSKCGEVKPAEAYHRGQGRKCKACQYEEVKQWRAKNPERTRQLNEESRQRNMPKRVAYRKKYYRVNADKLKAASTARNKALKDAAYAAYGGYACNCCGEQTVEFLNLDHVENNGAVHRREIGARSIYQWLKANNYPPGFQVLCANCNQGKRMNGGVCPHKRCR